MRDECEVRLIAWGWVKLGYGLACINYEGCGMFALVNKSCLTLGALVTILQIWLSVA